MPKAVFEPTISAAIDRAANGTHHISLLRAVELLWAIDQHRDLYLYKTQNSQETAIHA